MPAGWRTGYGPREAIDQLNRVAFLIREGSDEATIVTCKDLALMASQRAPGSIASAIDWAFSKRTGFGKVGIIRGMAPHAHLIEFGTKPRHWKTGKYTGIGPARPYMMPAIEFQRPLFVQRVKYAITHAVDGSDVGGGGRHL